jgi:hypothetical protein
MDAMEASSSLTSGTADVDLLDEPSSMAPEAVAADTWRVAVDDAAVEPALPEEREVESAPVRELEPVEALSSAAEHWTSPAEADITPAAPEAPPVESDASPARPARPTRPAVRTARAARSVSPARPAPKARITASRPASTRPAPPPRVATPVRPAPPARAAAPVRPGPIAGPRAARPGKPARPGKAVASCPYCAEPLPSPPVASGRCPRCRQRIVVRRVGDRAVLLTEAALPVFLAERKRAAHIGPWTRARDRWLELAIASGAGPDRITRLTREPLSEEVIKRSRALYVSTVEQSARQARRDRRWDEAGRLVMDLAQSLYRVARSPRPVPAEIIAVHRDGLAATLRGIAEVAKSAELRAGSCCEACQADDGRMVRIAAELRSPSLPHEACPKGLCRCRWYLAERDRNIVSGLLRRQTRGQRPRR